MKTLPMPRRVPALLASLAALAFAASCSRHHDHDGHDHHDHDHAGHNHAPADAAKEEHACHDAHDGHDHAPAKKNDNHDHDHHDHDNNAGHSHSHGHGREATNVTYDEKTGLKFDAATAAAINLATTRIAARPLAHRITLNATVIDAGPPARVTALVPPAVADDMEQHPHDGVRLLAVDRALTHATAQVEVTLALTSGAQTSAPAIGDTLAIPLVGPPETKLVIPNAAILRTVAGAFAYRFRDGAYQRVPLTLGVTDGAHTEILAGLSPGEEVAAATVEQLWLTELRLTKGGGHSH